MKKRWKILFIVLLTVALAAAGVAVFFFLKTGSTLPKAETQTVEVQVGIGEEVEYVQLLAVRGNEITYTSTKGKGAINSEEETEYIPVGCNVTTKLGTVTTFSRLRAGDNVALVRDKSIGEITAVYIVD